MMWSGKKARAWLMACLLIVAACMPLASHAEQASYEGPGWDTPEDAVSFYLEGLKEQDLGKMISAYAVETYVGHFDLQAHLARIKSYFMTMVPRMPNSNGMFRAVNVEARKSEIVQSIVWQMASICQPGQDFTQTVTFTGENADEETRTFVEGLENAYAAVDFSTLEVLLFTPPEKISEIFLSEKVQENIKAQAAPFGPDEARSVVALFTVDNKLYALCCDVMRYGDRWYMYKPSGIIGAIVGLSSLTGGVVPVPQEELEAGALENLDAVLSLLRRIWGQ